MDREQYKKLTYNKKAKDRSKYYDPTRILPYQRNFIFINGVRSIGKTYSWQLFILDYCLKNDMEFIYLVRTKFQIRQNKIFKAAFEKVLLEFPNLIYEIKDDAITIKYFTSDKKQQERILGRCISISGYREVKQMSFPNVKFIMFDEYMIEGESTREYVDGFQEPNRVLSIYHTIDRDEDRVIFIGLGNNTTFYNPYHMHPAFNIPYTPQGGLWMSENVLFQWASPSELLREEKSKTRFDRMIQGSLYGNYASKGDYVNDSANLVEQRTKKSIYYFTLDYLGKSYGVFVDEYKGVGYISEKYDEDYPRRHALTLKDHKENTLLTKGKTSHDIDWLSKQFKLGNIRYESMEIKALIEKGITLIL